MTILNIFLKIMMLDNYVSDGWSSEVGFKLRYEIIVVPKQALGVWIFELEKRKLNRNLIIMGLEWISRDDIFPKKIRGTHQIV